MTQASTTHEDRRKEFLDNLKPRLEQLEAVHREREFRFTLAKGLLRFLQYGRVKTIETSIAKGFIEEILAELSVFTNDIGERDIVLIEFQIQIMRSVQKELADALLRAQEPRSSTYSNEECDEI